MKTLTKLNLKEIYYMSVGVFFIYLGAQAELVQHRYLGCAFGIFHVARAQFLAGRHAAMNIKADVCSRLEVTSEELTIKRPEWSRCLAKTADSIRDEVEIP